MELTVGIALIDKDWIIKEDCELPNIFNEHCKNIAKKSYAIEPEILANC